MRGVRFAALALACVAVVACGSTATSRNSAIPTVAARLFTLPPREMPAYTRSLESPLTPAVIAGQLQNSDVQQQLVNERMVSGDLAQYEPQSGQAPPFDTVSSQAVVFEDATGAAGYYAAEQRRIDVKPAGGTIDAAAVTTRQAEASCAYSSMLPAGATSDTAYIFLARKGRVVVELFAHQAAAPAATSFQSLVTMQDALLATSPDVTPTR
jgi:hypothetical protein